MNILILGFGAREHAMAYALAKSPCVHQIYVYPGNPAMLNISICKRLMLREKTELVKACKDTINLAVVCSSKFVEDGSVDALALAGIPIIGAAADAGRIESSKVFAHKFIQKHQIPAPKTLLTFSFNEAEAKLKADKSLLVAKCDGFSHGKGVVIGDNTETVINEAKNIFEKFGAPVLLQERLYGKECSYTILTDGSQWVSFSSCRDYKRAKNGDEGATTGGMGAVCPSPDLTSELEQQIISEIVQPIINGMKEDGLLYRGFLSIQLMLTKSGPRVLEFNARLGDPETQSILMRFRGDLANLLKDCAMGCLSSAGSEVAFGKHSAVSVVIAREGYPEAEDIQPEIRLTPKITDSLLFFSDCRKSASKKDYRFKSGRLITVSAVGETLTDARSKCYEAIKHLEMKRVAYRTDIGL